MTENKNTEPGRPSWAAGLDLSPELYRASDDLLKAHTISHWVLRRLADAEIRVAELTEELRRTRRDFVQVTDGREPDFLIDQHGDCWFRMESGGYAMQGEGEAPARSTIEIAYGPTTEAWK